MFSTTVATLVQNPCTRAWSRERRESLGEKGGEGEKRRGGRGGEGG